MPRTINPNMLVASSIAAVALMGGAGFALAQDAAAPAPAAEQGAPEHDRGHGNSARLADLAQKLGVSTDELKQAFDKNKPAEGERPQQGDMAQQLADALGKNVDDVKAALDSERQADQAKHREELAQRLDQAVTDGKISATDKDGVLKAFDAGVLGGHGKGDRPEKGRH